MTKRISSVLLLALLALAGTAFAQIDDRARELLEGLVDEAAVTEVRTMEQVMTMHLSAEDISTTTRTVIDFDNERAAIFTETMGMEVVMLFVDGNMSMKMQGMTMPAMPGMEGTFDGMFDDVTYDSLLDYPDVSATYDGVVSYADVLSGHQVTYSGGEVQAAGVGAEFDDSGTVRFIFDDAGKLIGNVVTMDAATDLVSVLIGEPQLAGLPVFDTELYQVTGGSATLFATMNYEAISINEPIDETLFQ